MNQPKRFKRGLTLIEQLPNELFVEIVGYLNGVDTVYAFAQLNNRFQSLLNNYVNILDFKSISKVKFDFVTQHHDIHRWRSLRLSDDDHTPGQIKLFCQLFPPAQYISQLDSRSVLNMLTKYAEELLLQLASFDHLVSLTIGNICGRTIVPFQSPSLKRLAVISCEHTGWMMNFSFLKNLEYTIIYNCCPGTVLTIPTTLTQLKLFYEYNSSWNALRTSLYQLSQLRKLALYDKGGYSPLPNGREWEELIRSSLPLLKTFQFYFPFQPHSVTSDALKRIMGSFSTPFYLLEKRWFIRCDSDIGNSIKGAVYSLPYAFVEMPLNISSLGTSMSTLALHDIDQTNSDLYAMVKTLILYESYAVPKQYFITSNVINVVLHTSLDTNWLSLLTNLHRLELGIHVNISSANFAHLLAASPRLQLLLISMMGLERITDNFTNNAVCKQLSEQIKSLTIASRYLAVIRLDVVLVHHLHSMVHVFGERCEHLSLAVREYPNTVLRILHHMRQLRSLNMNFETWSRRSEIVVTSWLRRQQTAPTDMNVVHPSNGNDYHVWFGNRQ